MVVGEKRKDPHSYFDYGLFNCFFVDYVVNTLEAPPAEIKGEPEKKNDTDLKGNYIIDLIT